jgi:hypothetical protein
MHCLLQAISTAAEQESPVKPSSVVAAGYDMDALAADDLEYNYDKAGLAALRRRLAAAIHDFKGAHAQYKEVIRQVRFRWCGSRQGRSGLAERGWEGACLMPAVPATCQCCER